MTTFGGVKSLQTPSPISSLIARLWLLNRVQIEVELRGSFTRVGTLDFVCFGGSTADFVPIDLPVIRLVR